MESIIEQILGTRHYVGLSADSKWICSDFYFGNLNFVFVSSACRRQGSRYSDFDFFNTFVRFPKELEERETEWRYMGNA
jgi:hypothetical protein